MKTRRTKLVSMLLVLVVVLGAFGAALAEGAPQSDVTLKYWAAPLANNEKTTQVWQKVFEGFKAETGISVEIEIVPWADTTKKITTAITSGEGPDIVGCGNNMSVQLSPTGALLPLTPERMAVITGGVGVEYFYENVTGEVGKDPVTISLNGGVHVLAYNVEAFKSVGLDAMPEDWDSFIAACQKLTVDNDGDGKMDVYGLGMWGQPPQSWKMFYNKFVQFGGELLNADGVPGFDSDAGRETFRFLGDLIATYKIVPPAAAEWTQDDMVNAFVNGQVMAVTIDNETIGTLNDSPIKDNFMIAELPYILPGADSGTRCSGHTGGTNLGIFSKTQYEQECLQFLEYVSRPEISEMICKEFAVLSAVRGVYEGKELDELTAVQIAIVDNAAVRMPLVPYFLPSINATAGHVQNILVAAAMGTLTDQLVSDEAAALGAEVETIMANMGY